VFLDPPHSLPGEDVTADLRALTRPGWLAGGAVVVVERSARSASVGWPAGYHHERDRRYGETVLTFGSWPGHGADPLRYGRDALPADPSIPPTQEP